jgi:hypothetical protein
MGYYAVLVMFHGTDDASNQTYIMSHIMFYKEQGTFVRSTFASAFPNVDLDRQTKTRIIASFVPVEGVVVGDLLDGREFGRVIGDLWPYINVSWVTKDRIASFQNIPLTENMINEMGPYLPIQWVHRLKTLQPHQPPVQIARRITPPAPTPTPTPTPKPKPKSGGFLGFLVNVFSSSGNSEPSPAPEPDVPPPPVSQEVIREPGPVSLWKLFFDQPEVNQCFPEPEYVDFHCVFPNVREGVLIEPGTDDHFDPEVHMLGDHIKRHSGCTFHFGSRPGEQLSEEQVGQRDTETVLTGVLMFSSLDADRNAIAQINTDGKILTAVRVWPSLLRVWRKKESVFVTLDVLRGMGADRDGRIGRMFQRYHVESAKIQ